MKIVEFLRDCYFLERDIESSTRAFVVLKVGIFGAWLGRSPTLNDLNAETINRFVAHRLESRSRETVRGERATLRAIWEHAFQSGIVADPPLRLRKIKRERRPVDAWGVEDARRFISAASKLTGRLYGKGIPRRDYYRAVGLTLFSTGLRVGDLLALRFDQLNGPGPLQVRQKKTGQAVTTCLTAEAWESIQAIRQPERTLIFGVLSRRSYFVGVRKIAQAAELTGGSKMFRRGVGSLRERDRPGEGHLQLGNSREVFLRHYNAARISQPQVWQPPAIGG